MSVQRLRHETTSTEFAKWAWYLRNEWDRPTKQDWYMAQNTAAIKQFAASLGGGGSVSVSDCLMVFQKPESKKPMTDEEKAEFTKNSKAVWAGMLAPRKVKQ